MAASSPPPSIVARPRTVRALRYATALREGGSLPGLVEADDDGLYVVKFRGAGQGPKALVAEVIAGEIARALGLAVPELVIVDVDPTLARAEPDPEIQELVEASGGRNLGVDFLPGALPFVPAPPVGVTPELAADVVWLDALVSNVDRTPRNANMLVWHGRLWLIDHGAALYRHHDPSWPRGAARAPFPHVADHVLLPFAGSIAAADERPAAGRGAARGDRRRRPRGVDRRASPLRRAPARAPARSARLRARGRGGPWPRMTSSSTRCCA